MRMDLGQDETLRQQGWRVFRSSSRDHRVPMTGAPARIQRVKIGEAYPVAGVEEGVAVSIADREASREKISRAASAAVGGEDVPTGVMQYFSTILHNRVVGAVNGVPLDEFFTIGVAPFDGWLREVSTDGTAGDQGGFRIAVRTSAGGTFFRGFDQKDLALFTEFLEPDFLPLDARGTGNYVIDLRAGKVPVYAGDGIIAVLRNTNGKAINTSRVRLQVGVEAVVLGSLSRRVQGATAQLVFQGMTRASADAQELQARLALEQEKTRRAQIIEQGETARLALKVEAVKLAARAPAPAPPPRLVSPPAEPPAGEGLTFVAAWNPSFGNIGYLIPDPPRGGKVNVFDSKYSVFDITGKLVEQGLIIPVATDQDIPPGARLSAVTKGTLSPALALARAQVV